MIGAWPTARWGIPAFLTPAVDKKGRRIDSFTVNGADLLVHDPQPHGAQLREQAGAERDAVRPAPLGRAGWTFWAVESTMDEIAHATGQDPVEMRLRAA